MRVRQQNKSKVAERTDRDKSLDELNNERNQIQRSRSKDQHLYNEIRLRMSVSKAELAEVNLRIEKLKGEDLHISEHAMLRYLERFCNINMNEIKEQILPEKERIYDKYKQDGAYQISDNHWIEITDGVIVTVHNGEK